jgi:hypothetical protein
MTITLNALEIKEETRLVATDVGPVEEPATDVGPEVELGEEAEEEAEDKPESDPCPECENTEPKMATVTVDVPVMDTTTEACLRFAKRKAALNEAIAALVMEIANTSVSLKSARKEMDGLREQLERVISNGPQTLPLFDQQPTADLVPAKASLVSQPSAAGAVFDDGTTFNPDGWRSTTTEVMGISAGICKILAENPDRPILTLGDIADWTKSHTIGLTEIPRIGEGKAKQIDDACDRFWEQHAEYATGTINATGPTETADPTSETIADPVRRVRVIKPIEGESRLIVGNVYEVDSELEVAAERGNNQTLWVLLPTTTTTPGNGTEIASESIGLHGGEWEDVA